MAKGKILMSQPIHEAGIKLITDQGYVARVAPDFTEGTLIKEVQDAGGFLVRTAEIPASVINAGKVLKVIARHGVGYDSIDVKAATARKIPVCITPRANALSVAEHVLTFRPCHAVIHDGTVAAASDHAFEKLAAALPFAFLQHDRLVPPVHAIL